MSKQSSPANDDTRLALIRTWLVEDLGLSVERIEVASADASFRRYFRVFAAGAPRTSIVMDAPPGREDVRPYLKVSTLLERCGVHVPQVYAADVERGLVRLEDLGTMQYLERLRAGDDPDPLYRDALGTLADIQAGGRELLAELAPYDHETLERELALMPEWFCGRHLELALTAEDVGMLRATFDLLIREALAQPRVFVHRDYHSRNLMVLGERNPGVLDFQDALAGPIAYDLVSLLKDCYIGWPRERVERWVGDYARALATRGLDSGADAAQFFRWFDFIGLQRHLKVLGIFARLWYRDGKAGYLGDLPLTLDYVCDAASRYPELGAFTDWLNRRIVPLLAPANARERARRHRA
jgi:aminoglycoside/choline kinase family phosphotransferase